MTEETKIFHIGDVLSITTGMLVSREKIDGVYAILNWMTGEDLFTHQLPRAAEVCKPYLLTTFPELADERITVFAVGELKLMLDTEEGTKRPGELCLGWLSKITSGQYGVTVREKCEVPRLPIGVYLALDPIEELRSMTGKEPIVVQLGDHR